MTTDYRNMKGDNRSRVGIIYCNVFSLLALPAFWLLSLSWPHGAREPKRPKVGDYKKRFSRKQRKEYARLFQQLSKEDPDFSVLSHADKKRLEHAIGEGSKLSEDPPWVGTFHPTYGGCYRYITGWSDDARTDIKRILAGRSILLEHNHTGKAFPYRADDFYPTVDFYIEQLAG